MSKPYIMPRKKKDNESRKENLTRRLEENIEFYHACGRMSHVSFLEQLKDYIYHSNPPKDVKIGGVFHCDNHGGHGFVSDCAECGRST
ncbi:MAG: hypothetical protein COA54_02315 [Thiotrichaceae bacterium]|nr:MAG: hypothetical protein COA54_02315 [Thiotrichaceae bacterium]